MWWQHFLDGAPLELCVPLSGAEVTTQGDRELSIKLTSHKPDTLRISAESKRQRDELADATRTMAARSVPSPAQGGEGMPQRDLAAEEEDDDVPPPASALAHRAQIVLSDSDSEEEVWM